MYGIPSIVKLMQLPNLVVKAGYPQLSRWATLSCQASAGIHYVLGLLNFQLPLVLLLIIDHILLSGNSTAAVVGVRIQNV